ncbi:MAG: DUF932 domain-containing protein [Candidatus Hodarchaeales archaeon]
MSKAKRGTTICTLNELIFPVEFIDNPNKTNREYSKIVTGVIPETIPYFGEDELEVMKESLNDEELAIMIAENPATKTQQSEIDLNYCSPRYELVPNEMIFPKVEEIFKQQGIDFSVQYSHTDHARFYGNYTIEDEDFGYKMKGTNDVIKFIWNFQHSYNGLTKYKGVAGFFRLVCENGLVVPIQEMKDYNLVLEGKHTASILRSLEEFSNILVNVTNNLGTVKTAITDKYEKLGGVWVKKPEDRIKEVLQASKIAIVENSKFNTLNDILKNVEAEANNVGLGYNGRVNNWLIYNGINQYINDDSRNIASPEKRRDTDSKVLEYMLEYA